ncbi:MAG: S41 family peptidase [Faecalimonas umbilicata]
MDLRHYPSTVITYLLGEYIIPKQEVFACIGMPNKAMPGAFYEQEMVVGKGVLKEIQNDSRTFDSYEGKVIILMDEESQSQSEFAIMALRQAPNAIVVGSPSVGADGNVVKVSLPGEVIFSMTGLGVYTPEGEQTQRCGLKPDIECWQTVEGIKAGKDELLEEAIKLIK